MGMIHGLVMMMILRGTKIDSMFLFHSSNDPTMDHVTFQQGQRQGNPNIQDRFGQLITQMEFENFPSKDIANFTWNRQDQDDG
mmetsp:Transcript_86401/g.249293  ORF Transcript_86401/g.249293 Transcript_86401/m.249293 type:complete len:83 (-) Transcript_86401:11-259(-)